MFRVHQTHNEAFVRFLKRHKQWHLDTDREESGQSAVWLEVEMAKLFQTRHSDREKVISCSLMGKLVGGLCKNFVVPSCMKK